MDAIYDYLFHFSVYERMTVLLELLLIGVVVYWAVSFLEGTRGERLFRGVILVIGVGAVVFRLFVDQFHLERLAYLYKGFALIAILFIAVAFQPEIRRALMRIGQAGFLSSSRQQLSRTVEELLKAVIAMATARTGAIIVIQQQVRLGEFIDTGVKIDSKVTAELLKTIFYPGTALHDMAVVIDADRIVAARVQLPLVDAGTELAPGRQLGSRHRAAVGIASSSDALVVVVSEETGIISLARDGKLISNISENQLRKQLTMAVVDTSNIVKAAQNSKDNKTEPSEDIEKPQK